MADKNLAHTPGPWIATCYPSLAEARAEEGGWEWAGIIAPREGPLGSVWQLLPDGSHTGLPGSIETTEANARLIAAAPDLLEALKFAEAILSEHVAVSCDICDGEGGWTETQPPQMTPVRHREGCEYHRVRAAIAKAEGK